MSSSPDQVSTFEDLKHVLPRRSPCIMEVVMRRVFQVISLFTISYFGTSVVGDKPRAREQSLGDLIKQLGDKDPAQVCAAARALGKLGPAKDAAPALKELLKNRNGR